MEFKSYLAKGLLEGAVFVCDFLDFENDLVLSSGFVFENGKWHPLRENFVKSIHHRDDFKKQEYVSIRKQ